MSMTPAEPFSSVRKPSRGKMFNHDFLPEEANTAENILCVNA